MFGRRGLERGGDSEIQYDREYGERSLSIIEQIGGKFAGIDFNGLIDESPSFKEGLERIARMIIGRFPLVHASDDSNMRSDILFQLENIDDPTTYTCRLPAYITAQVAENYIRGVSVGVANDTKSYSTPTHMEATITKGNKLWTIRYGMIGRYFKVESYDTPAHHHRNRYSLTPVNIAYLERESQKLLKKQLG
jgi:hypothetical protein